MNVHSNIGVASGPTTPSLTETTKEATQTERTRMDTSKRVTPPTGLRERKKLERRRRILSAASQLFAERGYLPQKGTAVDMFPKTSHVECVILMQRSGLKDEK